ncbi:MAG: hypothetical protein V4510_04620 [bacterium]
MTQPWAETSRWLFVAMGAVWLLIGALTPVMMGSSSYRNLLFLSPRTDRELYGQEPSDALQNTTLRGVRDTVVLALAGTLVAAGLLAVAMAWFGLGDGAAWAFWSLAAAGAVVLPYWIMVLRPYWGAGVWTGLGDLPPFMWVTTLLWLAATTTGLIARGGA